jgi:hypothetical protein
MKIRILSKSEFFVKGWENVSILIRDQALEFQDVMPSIACQQSIIKDWVSPPLVGYPVVDVSCT